MNGESNQQARLSVPRCAVLLRKNRWTNTVVLGDNRLLFCHSEYCGVANCIPAIIHEFADDTVAVIV